MLYEKVEQDVRWEEGCRLAPVGCPGEFYQVNCFRRVRTIREAREVLLRHFPQLVTSEYELRIHQESQKIYTYRVTWHGKDMRPNEIHEERAV